MFKFENLEVWKKSMQLVELVDEVTKKFPKEELYILSSQIKRASDSIVLNIGEGSQGQSNPEFARFLSFQSGLVLKLCAVFILHKQGKLFQMKTSKRFTMNAKH